MLANGREVDVSEFGEDYDEVFFESDGLQRLKEWADQNADNAPPFPDETRYGAPIARPSKIICIGLNFSDHAAESGMELPPEPVIFFKASSAYCGPNDALVIPRGSEKTDWEVEIAFVVGKRASYVSESDAVSHLAGYVLHNAHYNLGIALWQLERREEAAEAILAASRLEPENPEFPQALARLYAQGEKWKEALPHARRVVELLPGNPQAKGFLQSIQSRVDP